MKLKESIAIIYEHHILGRNSTVEFLTKNYKTKMVGYNAAKIV